MPATFPIDLARADTGQISEALDKGVVTSVDLVKEYRARIIKDNHAGKCLRAVLQLVPAEIVLAKASELDRMRAKSKLGPLHGIPILIQDSITTAPELKLDTTAGSPALRASGKQSQANSAVAARPRSNAPIVQQLINAGAIVLGKTNLTMMHNWYNPGIPSGWSPLGGQVVSAFGPDLPVRGGSAGNAVAVSAGWCAFAVGTESCGGLTTPAGLAGVYALKPGPGRINAEGVVPNCPSIIAVGTMGRSAHDMALHLDVLSKGQTSLVKALGPSSVPTIGIVSLRHCQLSGEEQQLLAKAVTAWPGKVVEDIWLEHFDALLEGADHLTTFRAGAREAWHEYLAGTDGPFDSLEDVVAWHDQHPLVSFSHEHPGQLRLQEALEYEARESDDVATARETMKRAADVFVATMDKHGLDVLVWPTSKGSFIATAGDFPSCTAPIGVKADGCPYGVSAVARRDQEDSLVRFMAAAEKAFGPRPVPDGF